jgi:hypothetical protein
MTWINRHGSIAMDQSRHWPSCRASAFGRPVSADTNRFRSVDLSADNAARLMTWLALDEAERDNARSPLAKEAVRHDRWVSVANRVIAAARGRLDERPAPPTGIHGHSPQRHDWDGRVLENELGDLPAFDR